MDLFIATRFLSHLSRSLISSFCPVSLFICLALSPHPLLGSDCVTLQSMCWAIPSRGGIHGVKHTFALAELDCCRPRWRRFTSRTSIRTKRPPPTARPAKSHPRTQNERIIEWVPSPPLLLLLLAIFISPVLAPLIIHHLERLLFLAHYSRCACLLVSVTLQGANDLWCKIQPSSSSSSST